MMNKLTRPDELPSKTFRVKTGYGNLYITVSELDNEPFEIFCHIGKSGASILAKAEIVGRLTSLALRYGVPLEEVVKQLVDIRGEKQLPWKDVVIRSIPDAVGKILKENYLCPTTIETK